MFTESTFFIQISILSDHLNNSYLSSSCFYAVIIVCAVVYLSVKFIESSAVCSGAQTACDGGSSPAVMRVVISHQHDEAEIKLAPCQRRDATSLVCSS